MTSVSPSNDRTALLPSDKKSPSYDGSSFYDGDSVSVELLEKHMSASQDDDLSHATLNSHSSFRSILAWTGRAWTLRRLALELSLAMNVIITITKAVAFFQTRSLSVLAALLDSILDVVSQIVLSYTDHQSSSLQERSSAVYPAGAARLEPIGVLTCAALMGMASFEVVKEASETLIWRTDTLENVTLEDEWLSLWSMALIVGVKLMLLLLCQRAGQERRKTTFTSMYTHHAMSTSVKQSYREGGDLEAATDLDVDANADLDSSIQGSKDPLGLPSPCNNVKTPEGDAGLQAGDIDTAASTGTDAQQSGQVLSDPTLEALAQDHWNDSLSNAVAFVALLCALYSPKLWWVDPVGAIAISLYIIYSWFDTGREQIEHLTGKSAPDDFIEELRELASHFDERILVVDTIRAYHFGPKFLVELEVVLPHDTLLRTSHDLGMELQYEIEGREEVERCFVHIDYETRAYDEHVVSKVPSHVRHQLVQRRIVPPSPNAGM